MICLLYYHYHYHIIMSHIYFQKNQKHKLIDHITDLEYTESTKCPIHFIKTYKKVVFEYITLPSDLLNIILEYSDEHITLIISSLIRYSKNNISYTHIIHCKDKFNIGMEFVLNHNHEIRYYVICILSINETILTLREQANDDYNRACDNPDPEYQVIFNNSELPMSYLDDSFEDYFINSNIFFQHYMARTYNKHNYMYDYENNYESCEYACTNEYVQKHDRCGNYVNINIKNHKELKQIIILMKMISDVIQQTIIK